jgi:hypothetical protein
MICEGSLKNDRGYPPVKSLLSFCLQHVFYKDSVSSRRVIHKNVGTAPTNFPSWIIGLPLTLMSSKGQKKIAEK